MALIPAQPSAKPGVKKDMEAVAALDRDAELMLRVREGDDTSFALLLERHRGPVVHFLYRMVQNPSVSEELAQEVFCACIAAGRRMSRRRNLRRGYFGLQRIWR